jgi:hypothetical protein
VASAPRGLRFAITSDAASPDRPRRAREASAWLATLAAETAATFAAAPEETILPAELGSADPPSAGGARALAMLEELAGRSLASAVHLRAGDVIAEGGMGVIRSAEQVALGRTVAIKSLKPGRRPPAAALDLLREAWVTGSLEHPNVVPVHYLAFDDAGEPLIVLKRIEGVEWRALLREAGEVQRRFGASDLLAWNLGILLQVLNALRFAHSRGIIHRDLKPSNVMIGDFGEVYLLDWGIAVSLRDDGTGRLPLATSASQLAGTPAYMAPEMLRRADDPPLDGRTDIYLAGAVLYELISGRPPHAGTDPVAVIASIIESRPELPSGAPAELARICARAMHADPAQRYESIEALRLALQAYLEHRGSAQLATRAEGRLAELRGALRSDGAGAAASVRDEVYRLFGACRSGFHDALSVWPENEQAAAGLVDAAVAVAEYELRSGHPDVAVRLLGELPTPPPLMAEARVAAAAQAARRTELEQLRREHDLSIGTRTRTFLMAIIGAAFTVVPLVPSFVPSLTLASHRGLLIFAVISLSLVVLLGLWARETLGATLVNRRLASMALLLFVVQLALALGGWALAIPVPSIQVIYLLVYATVVGGIAIAIDRQLWPSATAYLVAFAVASWRPAWCLYLMSAADLVLTINAVRRWWPASLRLTPEERAARAARR